MNEWLDKNIMNRNIMGTDSDSNGVQFQPNWCKWACVCVTIIIDCKLVLFNYTSCMGVRASAPACVCVCIDGRN